MHGESVNSSWPLALVLRGRYTVGDGVRCGTVENDTNAWAANER